MGCHPLKHDIIEHSATPIYIINIPHGKRYKIAAFFFTYGDLQSLPW